MGEDYTGDRENMTDALNAALAASDLERVMGTLGEMARAYRINRIAYETGLGRESLYKSMRAGASPEFATVLKVLNSLGLRLQALPVSSANPSEPPLASESPRRTEKGEWQLMDEAKVNRDLALIGKQSFVNFFELLADFDLPDSEVADYIASELGCTVENALSWRVKPARTLIRAGQAKTALLIIGGSNRLPSHVTRRASDLANGTTGQ